MQYLHENMLFGMLEHLREVCAAVLRCCVFADGFLQCLQRGAQVSFSLVYREDVEKKYAAGDAADNYRVRTCE